MRTCPNCGKAYSNDLFFCLDDGTRLRDGSNTVNPTAPTEVAYDVGTSLPTEVIRTPETIGINKPNTVPTVTSPVVIERNSKLPYIAIGLLVIACLGLTLTLIVLNIDRILPSNKSGTNSNLQIANTTAMPSPAPSTSLPTPIAGSSPTSAKLPDRSSLALDPSGKWSGSWSTQSGTLFDFVLTLSREGNALDGSIRWTMRRTARSDKSDKIGLSATEYVRGAFDPSTGVVNLSGYSKDDPDGVLVMVDVYKLQVSNDGRKLTGAARNGGKWNGKVDLSR